jgi:hypothetical protein
MIGLRYYGLAGIFAAYALANIVTGFGAYAWARHTAHRLCPAQEALAN